MYVRGYCLGLLLWLLISNIFLTQLEHQGIITYAFVVDFSLVFLTHRCLYLEQAAARVFQLQHSADYRMHLHLSFAKSEVLIFAKPHKIERYPSMRIIGTSLHHVPHIKVLGVAINKQQNQAAHLKQLKLKLVKKHHNA